MVTEAQKRATMKYNRANTVQVSLKFIKSTDADILERLEEVSAQGEESRQGYIKRLILDDMKKRP